MARLPLCLSLVVGLAAGVSSSHGQSAGSVSIAPVDVVSYTPPRVYEGQCVVSVRISDVRQLRVAMALIESSWTERPGVGEVIAQVRTDRLDALRQLGVDPVVLIDDLQAHTDAKWRELQDARRFELQRPGAEEAQGAWMHDESWFTNFRQYSEILSYMDSMTSTNPGLVSRADFGDSVEGRDLWAYTITGPDAPGNAAADRPVVLFNGGQHAREWINPMTVTYIASRLVDGYGTDAEVTGLMDSARFVIAPVVNPDGYLYSWSTERYWRKNRRNNPGSFEGVDLNRNWGFEWGGDGASGDTSSDIYHGPSPFSEPETQALRDLALSYGDDLASHIDYHSFSQLILWPLGYEVGLVTPEPDRSMFIDLTGDMSDLIESISGEFYNPIQSWQLYAASGTCSDWFYGGAGVPSLTIELRPDENNGIDGFSPPASIILPTAQENFEAAKLFAGRTTQPLVFDHGGAGIVESGIATPIEVTISDGVAELDESSVTMWSRVGTGSFTSSAMTGLGLSRWGASLPGAPCDTAIEYYFTADTLGGDSLRFPSGNAVFGVVAQDYMVGFDDDMETNQGWTVGAVGDDATTGVWERADPEGTSAQPEDDRTPDGTICFVTGASAGSSIGSNDIDGGVTTLTSPAMDATASGEDAELVYWRWYSNDQGASPNADSMLVQISSNNGASWSTLETVSENAGVWVEKRFRVADVASVTDQVRVRFVAGDEGDGSIVEAAIDDVRIESVGCDGNAADLNGDGELDFFDVSLFLQLLAAEDPRADFNGDGSWDFFDVSAFLQALSAG